MTTFRLAMQPPSLLKSPDWREKALGNVNVVSPQVLASVGDGLSNLPIIEQPKNQ
jgi:hypothetical protein